jgi:hypothetical protein
MSDNIFTYINSILYKKKLNEKIQPTTSEYNQYSINRWLSMYSADVSNIINSTVNRYGSVLEKQEHYEFLYNLLNKCKNKKINYLKKSKKVDGGDLDVKELCDMYELSEREIKEMIDLQKNINN